ncbi:uncharacterized protein LOC117784330 [Drosophila innubila]|uniref:uncharacterized protein LOC117784330 n=1 Tax=Drosophila innubila TaxID=198719 RepID=UPI00148CEE74|nr:uncharacterized protein LOC117784330 [Drosophila innubila]
MPNIANSESSGFLTVAKMCNLVVVLALLISVGSYGVLSASNVTGHMEDYIRQNQRQYEARLKKYEDEMATFRETYGRELRAISVQADQLQLKLEEATERLRPLELIDSWHRQCVQNYSASLPTIVAMRTALTACSTGAQNNLNGHLQNSVNTYNSLKSYHANNVKALFTDCEKRHPASQQNYTDCITTAIATANTNTIANQKNFNTYMQQSNCAANTRINQAWECAFTTVHSTISTLAVSLRLIDDCIANKLACASVSCTTGCKNHMVIILDDNDFLIPTINNPFYGFNSNLSCLEIKFKVENSNVVINDKRN